MKKNTSLIFVVIGIIVLLIGAYFIIDTINKNNDAKGNNSNLKNIESVNESDIIVNNNDNDIDNKINMENSTDNSFNNESSSDNNLNKNNNKISSDISKNTKTEENNGQSKLELKQLGSLQYYLYIPSNPTSNMPLIMYLHGGTNKNSVVTALLTTDGFPKYLYEGYYGNLRAYVVIPKLDNYYKGWADISDHLRNLMKSINTNYQIDMNKVALTGHSMGGTGTYQVQVKLPNTFACIAPMSGSIQNNETNINALGKTKIWAFIGTSDTIVDPNSSRVIINELKNRGKNAKITEFEGAGHFDVPALAYKNDALIKWLVNCGQ